MRRNNVSQFRYILGLRLPKNTKKDQNEQQLVGIEGWPSQSILLLSLKGKPYHTKTDEFSEKFQAAFDHPSFSEKKCCTFLGTHERLRPFPKDGNEQS